jgi:hypothetical protein
LLPSVVDPELDLIFFPNELSRAKGILFSAKYCSGVSILLISHSERILQLTRLARSILMTGIIFCK